MAGASGTRERERQHVALEVALAVSCSDTRKSHCWLPGCPKSTLATTTSRTDQTHALSHVPLPTNLVASLMRPPTTTTATSGIETQLARCVGLLSRVLDAAREPEPATWPHDPSRRRRAWVAA